MSCFKYIIVSIVCSGILCGSCVKDTITVKRQPIKKLSLSGFVCPDSTCVSLFPAGFGALYDSTVQYIKTGEAVVVMYENDVFFDTLHFTTGRRHSGYVEGADSLERCFVTKKRATPGNEYRIEVTSNDYPSLSATTSIPRPVPIDRLDTISEVTVSEVDGSDITTHLLEFSFTDDDSYRGYYCVPDVQTYEDSSNSLFVNVVDNSLFDNKDDYNGDYWDDVRDVRFFSDTYISGKTYSLRYRYGIECDLCSKYIPPVIKVRLYSISVEHYKYLTSKLKYLQSRYDPNSEPVHVYSNVEGGFGIFVGYSYSEREFRFRNE